ncbi:MAG: Hpt domain-containing protein [Magnetococcales bacterium]|nr:Hpt domain-containing protein [Magnetococcales bacterium]
MEPLTRPSAFDGGQKIRLLHAEVGGYVRAIVDKFFVTLPKRLAALSRAFAASDLPSIQREAHKLKGAAATLGADLMVQLCCQLEEQSRAGQRPSDALLTALQDDAREVVREMNRTLDALQSG